ncbi:TonB-dependent receptor [Maribellus sp. CM-23]|uniref:TonB-dependent receptor n=1 Tax=Maribellus sp. CM-23 TaxID=2781026 RepID=UPI001F3A8630|nr:TonB-dependent receptor [Maribellus sp. CM-23]MCE4566609.1 TonB-dependent receptor [Maribellus sp. CM-23]
MKKNVDGSSLLELKKLFLIMRLIILLLITSFVSVGANSYSQTARLTINLKSVTIEKIFDAIENQSEYIFFYQDQIIDLNRVVSIEIEGKAINEVLDELFENTGNTYQIEDRQILVGFDKSKVNTEEKHLQDVGSEVDEPQKRVITGKVSDENGESLPGASVVVKGTTLGVTTDMDGNYSLEIPNNAEILVFSFVGMKSQELAIGNQTQVNASMKADMVGLEEVVAIGYGVQNKRDVTTSIASVKAEDLQDLSVSGFDQALAGKMAGVQVLQTTGEPGAALTIKVRGTGSITAGNDPLYVIDGIPADRGAQAVESVNVDDIESIEVLKDASAAAIYGSRGSNGVVIITTKSGKTGKMRISYDASFGLQEASKTIDMLDAYQYAELSRDGHNNAYLDAVPNGSVNDPNEVRKEGWMKIPPELLSYLEGKPGLTNTDWQDQIFRTSPLSKHTLSFSGGSENIKYFISANYFDQEGIIINSDYKKYGIRLNLDAKFNKLKVGVKFNPSFTSENVVDAYGPYSEEGIVAAALGMSPTWPVYNEDGSYNFDGNGFWRIGTDYQHNEIINPVAQANLEENKVNHANLIGNGYLEYELLEGLKYKLSTGITYNHYHADYYRPSTLPTRGWKYYDEPSNPIGWASTTYYINWVLEHTLSYAKRIGDHNLRGLAGFSSQKNYRNNHRVEATNFPNDLVHTIGAGTVTDGTSGISEWSLLSVLGRIQYDYKGKYLLTAAIRADGSSRFGENNKWGYFPSSSVGWRVTEEEFLKGIRTISNLKLRASYGMTGNFQIGNYEHISRVSKDNYVLGSGDGQGVNGLKPSNVENADLGWEKTAMLDIGIDIGLFRDRINIEADWYNSNTSDLLLNVPVPFTTGFGSARQNIGKVNNSGWEFTLTTRNKIGKVDWTASLNFSTNKNEVKALGPENAPIITTAGTGHAYFITQVGERIGSYYLLVQDGVFKNQEELDKYPHFDNTQVGDFRFVDVDKDGVMDVNNDRTIVGNYAPDFTYGFSSSLKYKGIDVNFNVQGVQGNEILHLLRRYNYNMEGNFNNSAIALNRWISEENPGDGNTNRANRKSKGNNGRTSTWHIEDGSYIRLQNVTLGYTLPKTLTSKIKIDRARIYVTGQNLLTITDYSGYNPEVNLYDGSSLTPGVDYGTYPLPRTVTMGLNINF